MLKETSYLYSCVNSIVRSETEAKTNTNAAGGGFQNPTTINTDIFIYIYIFWINGSWQKIFTAENAESAELQIDM